MVLAELGQQIGRALQRISAKSILNDDDIKDLLNEIARALLQADVNIGLVKKLQEGVKAELLITQEGAGLNKRKILQDAIVRGIKQMLDPGVEPFMPVRKKTNVVMFVGLQGAGKTTTCTKYAAYFQRKGFKVGLVCADTFRAGAYDQLRQNAAKAGIRFYGSLTEADPVIISKEGVEVLKREKYDLILVDTSGRHKQEVGLFDEMAQLEAAIRPDDIVFVMSGTDGQAVKDQAQNFKARVKVGSVIITKLDCQTKGGGALSAVAATKSPIVFIGTGEHFDDFEPFKAEGFVGKMLGMGDLTTFMDTLKSTNLDDKALAKRLQEGQFTLRDLREYLQKMTSAGPVGKLLEMIPGMSRLAQASGNKSETQLKTYLHIMDSMTNAELDDARVKKIMTPSRMHRIARGSGTTLLDVQTLILAYANFEEMGKKMGRLNLKSTMQDPSSGPMANRISQQQMEQLAKVVDPNILKQMGNAANMQNIMRQMMGDGSLPGGIPNMSNLMKMVPKVKFKR